MKKRFVHLQYFTSDEYLTLCVWGLTFEKGELLSSLFYFAILSPDLLQNE